MMYIDKIHIDKDTGRQAPGGGRIFRAKITRTGVFDYGENNKQLRPPEEVFDPESLNSLNNAPLTLLHPHEEQITPENFRNYVIGNVVSGTVRQDGYYVIADVLVADADALELINTGKIVELSAGYDAIEDDVSGIYGDNEPYDKIQRKIRYNHLSLVPEGRAGPDCRIYLDYKENNMTEKKTDTAAETAAEKEETITIKKSDLNKMIKDKMHRIDQAKKLKDTLDPEEALGLSDRELMEAVASEIVPTLDLAVATDDYVAGVFDALAARVGDEVTEAVAEVAPEAATEVAEAVAEVKTDSKSDLKSIKNRLFKIDFKSSQPAEVKHNDDINSIMANFEKSLRSRHLDGIKG
jgi:hypothetical protein